MQSHKTNVWRVDSHHVVREAITTRELLIAEVALEGLGAGMLPVVPCQDPRPGKLLVASIPWALVQLLLRVGPLVGLQV